MQLGKEQIELLKQLMTASAEKGNLANAGLVLEGENTLASAESLVISNHDATAHSERMLVEKVCKMKGSNYTPGLTMITVIEPCLMCMSACSQSGYKEIAYIIPGVKYVDKITWMTDVKKEINKQEIAKSFSVPLTLTHLNNYEVEFSEVFEKVMEKLLK